MEDGLVPLALAAICSHEACVGELLPAQASVEASDTKDCTALGGEGRGQLACALHGDTQERESCGEFVKEWIVFAAGELIVFAPLAVALGFGMQLTYFRHAAYLLPVPLPSVVPRPRQPCVLLKECRGGITWVYSWYSTVSSSNEPIQHEPDALSLVLSLTIH